MNLSMTKISALDDCLHLLEASDEMCEAFREAVRKARTFAFMADSVGLDEQLDSELLGICRTEWNRSLDEESKDCFKEKLALALGSIGYRGVARQEGLQVNGEESLYREAFLFRVYYVLKNEPSAVAVGAIWKAMRQRNMIELHTFIPYMPSIDEWFERMNNWDLHVETDRETFAEAVAETAKPDKYVSETHFYDPNEPILQLIVRLRRGEQMEGEALRAVLQTEAKSVYAKAVLSGFAELRKANEFFTGKTNNAA